MIVVTGGAGMIGSNLIKALNEAGEYDILLVDELSDGRKVSNIADLVIADYEDMDNFIDRFKRKDDEIEVVFHLGACSRTTEMDGRHMMRVNYCYSRDLLDACLVRSIPLIYASSASVYGDGQEFREDPACERPLNMYAYSKLLFDNIVRRVSPEGAIFHNLRGVYSHSKLPPICGLRYFNVYGPREFHKDEMASVLLHLHNQVLKDDKLRLFGAYGGYGAGEQSRDFIHVDDAVAVTLWCWRAGISGIFNCGTGKAEQFHALADAVIAGHGRGSIEFIDFPDYLKGRYQSFTQADLTQLREAGFEGSFRDIDTGAREYVSWLKSDQR